MLAGGRVFLQAQVEEMKELRKDWYKQRRKDQEKGTFQEPREVFEQEWRGQSRANPRPGEVTRTQGGWAWVWHR